MRQETHGGKQREPRSQHYQTPIQPESAERPGASQGPGEEDVGLYPMHQIRQRGQGRLRTTPAV